MIENDIACKLIESGKLSNDEIKTIIEKSRSFEVLATALRTTKFSDYEIIEITTKFVENNSSHPSKDEAWLIAMDNSDYAKLLADKSFLENIAKLDLKNMDSKNALTLLLQVSDISREKISDQARNNIDAIFKQLAKNNNFTKEQLVTIINKTSSYYLQSVALKKLKEKKASNKYYQRVIEKTEGDNTLEILKICPVSSKELIKFLRANRSNEDDNTIKSIISIFIKHCKTDAKKALHIAKRVDDYNTWFAFLETFPDYKQNLSELEWVLIFNEGVCYDELLQEVDSKILLTAINNNLTSGTSLKAILSSGRLSKEEMLTAIKEEDGYTPYWEGLLASGKFSDKEIVLLAEKHNTCESTHKEIWRLILLKVDLRQFLFNDLIELGELADDREVWLKINEALKKRPKKK